MKHLKYLIRDILSTYPKDKILSSDTPAFEIMDFIGPENKKKLKIIIIEKICRKSESLKEVERNILTKIYTGDLFAKDIYDLRLRYDMEANYLIIKEIRKEIENMQKGDKKCSWLEKAI